MYHLEERIEKIIKVLKELSIRGRRAVENVEICPCGYKTGNIPPAAGWRAFSVNDVWGSGKDGHAWFRFDINVPADWQGKAVALSVATACTGWDEFNPQLLCYVDGRMRQGMDANHRTVRIEAGKDRHIALYAYTGYESYIFKGLPDVVRQMQFFAEFVLIDTETEALFFDMEVPFSVLSYTDPESREYAGILDALNDCANLLDLRTPHSAAYEESVRKAREYIRKNYYEKNEDADFPTLTCIGQTHIDTAWVWPMRQTREKVQRSFSTALELMRLYPEYRFFASQPKQYQMLKEDAPEVYEELKKRVREGRWETGGAMWVEADCNLIGGESFVRQILHGKHFFKEEFGTDGKVLWLPDVFGYAASMPQILKLCGIDTFVTSKISWNDTNRMPFDLFSWKGIDGTEILSFFITGQEKTRGETVNYSVYNAPADAPNAAGTYARFGQKNLTDDVMMLYGYGDGGGGPVFAHLENIRRMGKGVANCPRTRIGTVGEYLSGCTKRWTATKNFPAGTGNCIWNFIAELIHLPPETNATTEKANSASGMRKCFPYWRDI